MPPNPPAAAAPSSSPLNYSDLDRLSRRVTMATAPLALSTLTHLPRRRTYAEVLSTTSFHDETWKMWVLMGASSGMMVTGDLGLFLEPLERRRWRIGLVGSGSGGELTEGCSSEFGCGEDNEMNSGFLAPFSTFSSFLCLYMIQTARKNKCKILYGQFQGFSLLKSIR